MAKQPPKSKAKQAPQQRGDEIDPNLMDDEAAAYALSKTPGAAEIAARLEAALAAPPRVKGLRERAYEDGYDNRNKSSWFSDPNTGKAWAAGRRDKLASVYDPKPWRDDAKPVE